MSDKSNLLYVVADYLTVAHIPFTLNPCWDGLCMTFPWYEGPDVACHSGTANQLETYRFPWDKDDVTIISFDELRRRLYHLYLAIAC